jgi:hypothetical protein
MAIDAGASSENEIRLMAALIEADARRAEESRRIDRAIDKAIEAGYRAECHPHGIVVYGPVPTASLPGLADYWQAEGYTIADPVIAAHLGATLAVTTAEGSRAWREELGL